MGEEVPPCPSLSPGWDASPSLCLRHHRLCQSRDPPLDAQGRVVTLALGCHEEWKCTLKGKASPCGRNGPPGLRAVRGYRRPPTPTLRHKGWLHSSNSSSPRPPSSTAQPRHSLGPRQTLRPLTTESDSGVLPPRSCGWACPPPGSCRARDAGHMTRAHGGPAT